MRSTRPTMAREKVKLAWITKDATRKATFKKRKKGLIKKASELSTLCGVKACAVIFGPEDPRPEIWSSGPDPTEVILEFKRTPEMERSKKMMNQESFLRQQVSKLQENIHKQERECRELEKLLLMEECLAGQGLDGIGIEAVSSLTWMVDSKVRMVQERIMALKGQTASSSGVGGGGGGGGVEGLERPAWLTEMMNPGERLFHGDENVVASAAAPPPFVDNANPWLDGYFPLD